MTARWPIRAVATVPLVATAALIAAFACLLARPVAASAAVPRPPKLAAPAAAVFEASTGTPLYGVDAGTPRLIASTTKMMTALVSVETLPLNRVCTAPHYPAEAAESKIGLRAGERMTVRDLLRALMLPSANDAAATLAVCGGTRAAFLRRMNERARQLGLRSAHFSTPVGLDSGGNHASAADLARLAIAVRRNAFLRRTVALKTARLHSGDHPRTLVNRNDLLAKVPWVNGVKTGHTNAAGYILVASGTQRGTTYVAAVLGDPSEAQRDADALALLKWAFSAYAVATPVARGAVYAHVPVKYRSDTRIDVVAGRQARLLLPRGARARVAVEVPKELRGPLPKGAVVGRATVSSGGRVLARIPLVTASPVPAVGVLEQVANALTGPGSLIAIVAILGGVALLVVRRRRRPGRPRRTDMEAA